MRRTVSCIILLFVSIAAWAGQSEPPRYFEVTFMTTNDLHAQDIPFTLPAAPQINRPETPDVGGLARIATVINRVRAEMRTPVVLTDSGDTSYGRTPMGRAHRGKSTIAAMNVMGYEAMVPGNHEFEWPAPDVLRNLKDSKFPWICANVAYGETGKLFVEPYIIREIGGVRVAFFGLTNGSPQIQPNKYVAAPELGLINLPAEEVAARLVPELRRQADIIVLVSHLGRHADVGLVQAVPGIDIVLGGHSHSTLRTPQMVPVDEPSGLRLGKVPVVQAGFHGLYVGKTRVVFHRDRGSGKYTLMSCKGELITIDSSIPDDPTVRSVLDRYPLPPPAPAPAPAVH